MTPTACRTRYIGGRRQRAARSTGARRGKPSSIPVVPQSILDRSKALPKSARIDLLFRDELSTNRSIARVLPVFSVWADALCVFSRRRARRTLRVRVEYVLFADQLRRSQRPPASMLASFRPTCASTPKRIRRAASCGSPFRCREKLLAQHFDLRSLRAFLPARRHGLYPPRTNARPLLLRPHQPVAVHGDAIFAA